MASRPQVTGLAKVLLLAEGMLLTSAILAVEHVPGGLLSGAGEVDRVRQVTVQRCECHALVFSHLLAHKLWSGYVEFGTQIWPPSAINRILQAKVYMRMIRIVSVDFAVCGHGQAAASPKAVTRDYKHKAIYVQRILNAD